MRTFASVVSSWLGIFAVAVGSPSSLASSEKYAHSDDGRDWPSYGRDFSEQHYSPLAQIDRGNIKRLGLEWWLDLGPESTVTQPIAVDGILYFATGYSIVHAVNAAEGKLLWRYDPKAAEKAGINLRYFGGSRGIAWWNGKIYTGTHDGRLIAIDARTGAPVWSVQTFDKNAAANITGAPRVFDGKVIIGYSSDTGKNRGYVTTYDADTGKQLWRFYTVPGNPADGVENKAMEMAARTWAGEWWSFGGGGAVWNAITYDPETDSVYIGVGGGYPGNRRVRSEDKGDNLFLSSIVALESKTGAYKWHYQEVPGDTWDYDAAADIVLADLPIDGKMLKVLMQASKNGFYYVIDRLTGRLVSAEPFTKVTWASKIDIKTGRPVEYAGARYENGRAVLIYPGHSSRVFMPMAYSPKQLLAYFNIANVPAIFSDNRLNVKAWQPPTDRTVMTGRGYMAADRDVPRGSSSVVSGTIAWNPVTQKSEWTSMRGRGSGILATAGDVVFQGEAATVGGKASGPADGAFIALDAATGKLLWSFATQGPVVAPPLSYLVNAKQYVSVLSGLGRQKRRMLTFALDGKATLPLGLVALPLVADPEFKPNVASAEAGARVYEAHCVFCHNFSDLGRLHAPDLRRSAIPLSAEAFASVVRDGAFVSRGMPVFGEFTDEQLAILRQYLRTEAQKLRKETETAR